MNRQQDFLSLLEKLRAEGFAVSLDQCVAVQEMLLRLARNGALSQDPRAAAHWVGPIVCRTPSQQQCFPAIFEHWWTAHWWLPEEREPKDTPPAPRPDPGRRKRPPGWLIWLKARPAAALILMVAAVALYTVLTVAVRFRGNTQLPPLAPDTASSSPSPLLQGNWNPWQLLGFVAVLTALWWVWRLANRSHTDAPETMSLVVRNPALHSPFEAPRYRRALLAFTRGRMVASSELDILASVHATALNGGSFSPVHGTVRRPGSLVALVHQPRVEDHQARLYHSLLDSLAWRGTSVDQYVFETTPLRARRKAVNARRENIAVLAERHTDEVLLLCCEATVLFDIFSGELSPWVDDLHAWNQKILLVPQRRWNDFEALLEETGWLIGDMEASSLEAVACVLAGEPARPPRTGPAPYPSIIEERGDAWGDRAAPGSSTEVLLIEQLKAYLGDGEFKVLCACAGYPGVSWEMTRYWCRTLLALDKRLPCLIALARLPWFRTGRMPDWLRWLLLEQLTPQERRRINRALRALLSSHGDAANTDFQLSIALPSSNPVRLLLEVAKRVAGLVAPGLTRYSRTEMVNDYVTLVLLFGAAAKLVDVRVPDDVAILIRRREEKQRAARRRRTIRAMVIAATVGLGCTGGVVGAWLGGIAGALFGSLATSAYCAFFLWPLVQLDRLDEAEQVTKEKNVEREDRKAA